MASFIKFDQIAKKVNNKNLLANLSLGIQKNEVLFILGQPGSGKTTLFKILMGIVEKDKGSIFIDGMNYEKRKEESLSIISYLQQENIFDKNLNILQNLYFYGQLKGMSLSNLKKEVLRWADILNFRDFLNSFPDELSFQILRKISLARCLLTDPKILLLDSPTLGMNFFDKNIFWQVINEYKKDKSILCISQDFEETELYSDRVVIIHNGSISMNSSLININKQMRATYTYQFIFKKIVPHEFLKLMKSDSNIKNIISRERYFEFSTKEKSIFFKAFQKALNYELVDLRFNYSKLNELYLKVTE